MTKKEIIQEAYGEDLKYLEPYINWNTGRARVPSIVNRSRRIINRGRFDIYIDDASSPDWQFDECFIPLSLPENFVNNNDWYRIDDNLPTEGVEVICYNEKWIHPDFNPRGIRIGFLNGDMQFITAHWWDYQDTYVSVSKQDMNNSFDESIKDNTEPTHWKEIDYKKPIY